MKNLLLLSFLAFSTASISLGQTPDTNTQTEASEIDPAVLKLVSILGKTEAEYREQQEKALARREKFFQLPKEKQTEYAKLHQKTKSLLAEKRIAEALYSAFEAENIFKDDLKLKYLFVTAYVELRDMDKAMRVLEDSIKLDPFNPLTLLNTAEVHFVTDNFKKSLEIYQTLEKLTDVIPTVANLSSMISFKKELSHLGIARDSNSSAEEKAKHLELFNKAVDARDYRDHSPLTYYGKAAKFFHNDNKPEAFKYINQAKAIFNTSQDHSMFADALVEFGFLSGKFEAEKTTPGSRE